MSHTNCLALNDDGSPNDGIPGVHGLTLRVELERCRPMTPPFVLNANRELPRCQGNLMLEAAPTHMPGGYPAFEGRGSWQGTLVLIPTARLAFPAERSSYFGEIDNAWRGAEVIGSAHVQVGERSFADQMQIVAVTEKESVVVADSWSRYVTICYKDGTPVCFPAEKEELGRLLVRRLEVRLPNVKHQALKWTWHTLCRLGLAHMWTGPLDQRMRSLERPIKKR